MTLFSPLPVSGGEAGAVGKDLGSSEGSLETREKGEEHPCLSRCQPRGGAGPAGGSLSPGASYFPPAF